MMKTWTQAALATITTVALLSSCASYTAYQKAKSAEQSKNWDVAIEQYEKALEIDGNNSDASLLGAVALLGFCAKDETSTDCRYDQAEKYARRALASNPQMRDAKNTLGVILVHEKRYDDAISVLKPLAEDILYASPEKSWGNLGWAYLEKGKPNEAVDALRRAVAAQPTFCVGNLHLGMAYEKKGDLSAARESLTRALETQRPGCDKLQDAYELRGRILAKQGNKEEAASDFQKCRDTAPSSATAKRCEAQAKALP